MTREEQMAVDGPMTCQNPDCVAWRKREPEFCQSLQDAGIIAHYMGHSDLFGGEFWMLDGITPVPRGSLLRCLGAKTGVNDWWDFREPKKNYPAIQRVADETDELRTEGKPIEVRTNPHD